MPRNLDEEQKRRPVRLVRDFGGPRETIHQMLNGKGVYGSEAYA